MAMITIMTVLKQILTELKGLRKDLKLQKK